MNDTSVQNSFRLSFVIDVVLMVLVFIWVNLFAFPGINKFPEVASYESFWWLLAWVCVVLLLSIFLSLRLRGLMAESVQCLKENVVVAVFLVVSALSLSWSTYFQASLFKLSFLLMSTGAGLYFSVRYNRKEILDIISSVAFFSIVMSFLIVFLTPIGIMHNYPYTGSWRGLFWHRNHAGSLAAFFNMIFLVRFFLEKNDWLKRLAWSVFYILAAVFTFKSRSAAGVIIFLVLNFSAILGILWVKWHIYVKRWHYYLTGLLGIVSLTVLLSNLGFFFGLLGRSSNMTGRTPLWMDLIHNVWSQHPLLGYGYGALWMQYDFREALGGRLGWGLFYPYFADNGFLDILLNLGLLGFLPFMLIFLFFGYHSLKNFIVSRTLLDLWVFLTFIYILFANIAYSFFLEVDQFVWMLMIMLLFASKRSADMKSEL